MRTRMTGLIVCLLAGCGGTGAEPDEPTAAASPAAGRAEAAAASSTAPLFERLGGMDAITAVVEDFVGRTTTDDRIEERFFNTDAVHLKRMLVGQICAATGGPCTYRGRTMKATHGGMELVAEEFDALVEDLVASLDHFAVPAREKGELLGALAAMKPDILAPPGQLRPIDEARLKKVGELAAKVKDARAAELLARAVVAGRRGQRSYAEQLFSRAELAEASPAMAEIAGAFREAAPPRVATPLERMPADTPAQPTGAVGSSDEDDRAPARKARSSLEGAIVTGGAGGLGVVTLEPIGRKGRPRTAKRRVIEQRSRAFAPHVMAVPVGSTIAFPNFDNLYHNVFSLSPAAAFDLGLYRNGEAREVTFAKEGVVRLGCNLHPDMAAFIIVVAAPHYAVADASGAFAFRRLQPGTYRMKVWSERSSKPVTREIEIGAGKNEVRLDVVADAVDRNPDKFGAER